MNIHVPEIQLRANVKDSDLPVIQYEHESLTQKPLNNETPYPCTYVSNTDSDQPVLPRMISIFNACIAW